LKGQQQYDKTQLQSLIYETLFVKLCETATIRYGLSLSKPIQSLSKSKKILKRQSVASKMKELSDHEKLLYKNRLNFIPTGIGICTQCSERDRLLCIDTCQICFEN